MTRKMSKEESEKWALGIVESMITASLVHAGVPSAEAEKLLTDHPVEGNTSCREWMTKNFHHAKAAASQSPKTPVEPSSSPRS